MVAGDPVGFRLRRQALVRPGRNLTGFMQFEFGLSGKWLELLKQIAPGVARAAVLRETAVGSGTGQFAALQAVAPSLRVEVTRSMRATLPKLSVPSGIRALSAMAVLS